MWNATGGKIYDFKERGIENRPKGMTEIQYRYRGMPIKESDGSGYRVYTSARDVGNIAAGYMAGRKGLLWEEARFGFDGLETLQHFPGLWETEGLPTQQAQRIGFDNGSAIYWMNKIGRK
jgi:hypothetical protein